MNKVSNDWVINCEKRQIVITLFEYAYLIKRFPQWFALLIGRIENQDIRQLLLPNLVDESGSFKGDPSHKDYVNSLIKSINYDITEYTTSIKTIELEDWFFNLFYKGDLYKCLCVLGPATESVSYQFLNPLEEAIKKCFSDKNVDYTYFEVHRPEIEIKHAKDLNAAIKIYENLCFDSDINGIKSGYIEEGISKHQEFWDNLKKSFEG